MLASSTPGTYVDRPAMATPAGGRERTWFSAVLYVLLLSFMLSVLLEWIGMVFFWPGQGAQHAQLMLQTELGYLNADFRAAVYGTTPVQAVSWLANTAYYWVFEFTRIERALILIGEITGLGQYITALFITSKVFLVRLGVLTFSLPAFVLFAVVGITTGLTLRDIRRWSAGREYGGVYHRAKWFIPKVLGLAWIVYLALPVSVHPNLVILPCALLFGANLLILSASFKKYL